MQFVLEFGALPLSMAKAIWRSSTLEASYALFPCLSSGQALLIPPLAEVPPLLSPHHCWGQPLIQAVAP